MNILTVSQARENLFTLIDSVSEEHEPVYIKGKRNQAVLVSDEDWRSMQETVYLLSIPGMREKLIEGMNTPIEECKRIEDIDW